MHKVYATLQSEKDIIVPNCYLKHLFKVQLNEVRKKSKKHKEK